ncbi:MAG TPA: LysM domain-containing protein [bacterium]|nr:LysM domain-containing protein [bacterium]
MFKFLVKVVVVVLAIQAGMGYLKKQEIISGNIKINYPVLKEKILKLIPTEKIAEKVQNAVTSQIKQAVSSKIDDWQRDSIGSSQPDFVASPQQKMLVHVVIEGETLGELSEAYDVPADVIKKINKIKDERDLTVGKQLKIPARGRNVT